jgi:hypothetical protein
LKGPLKTDPIECISKQSGKTRRGNQNFHRIGASHLKSADEPILCLDFNKFYTVHLAGKSPADKLFDDGSDPPLISSGNSGDIINERFARIVTRNPHGSMQPCVTKSRRKGLAYLDRIILCH